MRKTVLLVGVLLVASLLLTGCGKKKNPSIVDALKGVDVNKLNELSERAKSGDQAATAELMNESLKFTANLEAQQFANIEAVDAPANFPKELVYPSGKVVSAEDSGDAEFTNMTVEIKTDKTGAEAKEYYKNLLKAAPWKITKEENTAYGGYLSARNDTANTNVVVELNYTQTTKIVDIRITYTGFGK